MPSENEKLIGRGDDICRYIVHLVRALKQAKFRKEETLRKFVFANEE